MVRAAINGFGRIGRAAFKILIKTPGIEVVAINDLIPVGDLAYLLRYDTVYGRFDRPIEAADNALVVDGKQYRVYAEQNPAKLPWKELGVELVFECTGRFTDEAGMRTHLEAGAKRVMLSAPAKSEEVPTVVYGVNRVEGGAVLSSSASCTTNSIAPVFEILGRRIGVAKAMLTTVHAYTSSQELVDGPSRKRRRGRAAAQNIVPTTTGAAVAVTRILQQYRGLFDGVALRVPVPAGSISDITFVTKRPTSVEEVNSILVEEAASERYRDAITVSKDEIVSSDIIGDTHGAVVDLTMTTVVDRDLVKVCAWYDNEWGFANQMVRAALGTVHGG